ncbi:TetR/AcrR family transcriptional regulator [Mycolicibacterium vinylchloridicum]|uniref:TetR/AcrR family transcriptional regulator n=1 Tax=Mycolicibacterium vinylchloridicum TaxID=2736928 RepID=UPI0015CC303E|nr:TetR/AcrR family transcriptional regulator [Mycolicibacterium vinylchloridicum]
MTTSAPRSARDQPSAKRRPRGAPRRLILDAARDLFARQDYRSTTTREIAQASGIAEHLLFRHFGSKAALFRESLVKPFTDFVAEFGDTWQSVAPEHANDDDSLAQLFVGRLYDVFVEHKGLLVTLMNSDTLTEAEMTDIGIADVRESLEVLGQIAVEAMRLSGVHPSDEDLPVHSTVATIAGMAALRSSFFGAGQPSRDTIVSELIRAILHGFLHRPD